MLKQSRRTGSCASLQPRALGKAGNLERWSGRDGDQCGMTLVGVRPSSAAESTRPCPLLVAVGRGLQPGAGLHGAAGTRDASHLGDVHEVPKGEVPWVARGRSAWGCPAGTAPADPCSPKRASKIRQVEVPTRVGASPCRAEPCRATRGQEQAELILQGRHSACRGAQPPVPAGALATLLSPPSPTKRVGPGCPQLSISREVGLGDRSRAWLEATSCCPGLGSGLCWGVPLASSQGGGEQDRDGDGGSQCGSQDRAPSPPGPGVPITRWDCELAMGLIAGSCP